MEARPHILIVDDSADVTGALRVLFEETGNDVSVANTIRDAVAVADARTVDVMLLDLTLPDGDGLSVLATMRARAHRASRHRGVDGPRGAGDRGPVYRRRLSGSPGEAGPDCASCSGASANGRPERGQSRLRIASGVRAFSADARTVK